MAVVFDGKKESGVISEQVTEALKKSRGVSLPKLVSIFNARNPASALYTKLKQRAAEKAGIPFESFPQDKPDAGLFTGLIGDLNRDTGVGGILVQLPLFKDEPAYDLAVASLIAARKDVDCLTPNNLGLVQLGRPVILPATVRAVLEILARVSGSASRDFQLDKLDLLDQYQMALSWIVGKRVVVVGSRGMVGAPLISVLNYLGATVTGCHRKTADLAREVAGADVVIAAAGSPGVVKKEMVKEGAVVVDVGTSVIDGHVVGDVEAEAVEKASFFTPVPGGVGPMTIACLLANFADVLVDKI